MNELASDISVFEFDHEATEAAAASGWSLEPALNFLSTGQSSKLGAPERPRPGFISR